ncbi:amidohydrolase family protein [Burkholderia ambifaria]|uniref:amidohydrolase family protein n=1 Tax=Burkholderia ambifaria TaxID=152480 RepID=UPI00315C857B
MGLLHMVEEVLVAGMPGGPPATMDVLIDGDRFVSIAPKIDRSAVRIDEYTDGRGLLLIPGLINAHHHSHDRFDKGRFSGFPLEVWMGTYNPPTHRRNWSAREVYLRTLLNGIELLRGGTTTVVDDIHFGSPVDPEVVAAAFQAYVDLGIRADVSVAWADRPFHESIPYLDRHQPKDAAAKHSDDMPSGDWVLGFWDDLAQCWNGRVRFVFSPSGPQRCTTAFLRKTWDLARKHERPVLVHVLETRIQALTAQRFYGTSMVEFMHQHGLLDAHSVLAHGVWLTEHELDLIAAQGASVINNPACNLKLASGIAPVGEMLGRDIVVGLGTDNNNGNDLNSMFDAMRLASLVSGIGGSRLQAPVDAAAAFAMATRGGASAIGQSASIGRIEVGYKADFALLDLGSSAFLPLNDPLTQMVFCEQGQSMRQVYVDGRKVVDHGRITRIDEEATYRELHERLPAVQARIRDGEVAAARLRLSLEAAYLDCIADPFMKRWIGRNNALTTIDNCQDRQFQ